MENDHVRLYTEREVLDSLWIVLSAVNVPAFLLLEGLTSLTDPDIQES